ncbi:MAG TPA: shikimate kinase [Acidimicrobiales bacterium]|nr:shikimate kinase [Acidimicrobiales bacterium]
MTSRVLLIGMMGAGKSTVGNILAGRLGWPYLDSDAEIMRTTGMSVPEIFEARGEAAFRAEEARVLAEATTSSEPAVIAVAGGAVLDPDNRRRVQAAGLVVWLRADIATLAARVGAGAGRPLLGDDPRGALGRLYTERRDIYEKLADVTVDVDEHPPGEVADRVLAALHARA